MRIGFDLDGVITDIEKFQLDYGSKYYYENNISTIKNPDEYYSSDVFEVNVNIDNIFWNSFAKLYIEEYKPRQFSSEIIKKLKDDGNEIYIITARCADLSWSGYTNEKMQESVKKWLANNEICYDKIIFSESDKRNVIIENKIEVMVEDKPKNINDISKIIPTICYDARYNKNCKGKNIIRIYTFYDLYYKIKKINKT